MLFVLILYIALMTTSKMFEKLIANNWIKLSGEAEYVWDLPKVGNELYGAFVFAKHGPATLESLDATAALVNINLNK